MKTTVGIAKAQATLPQLVRSQRMITILKNGERVAVLVPAERLDMILETMEVLANREAMKAMRRFVSGKMKAKPLAALDED